MRNPERLYPFYEELTHLHRTYCPDWRFGQLMNNFLVWHVQKYSSDIFYVEDGEMKKRIHDFFVETFNI